MKDFIDYVMSGDKQDELAKTKAELSYALNCLEREIAIAQKAEAQLASVRSETIEECAKIAENNGWEATAAQIRELKDAS